MPDGDAPTHSDAQLTRLVRNGDAAAFAALWARHEGAARRAIDAVGAAPDEDLALVRAATATALRRRADPADPVRRHVLRIVGRLILAQGTFDRRSPILRAYAALPARSRTLLWYTAAEHLDPCELAVLLGIPESRLARRVAASRRALYRRWLTLARERGLRGECARVRRHELLTPRGPLAARLREHASGCPHCVIAAGCAGALLAHLGVLLVDAEIGPEAGVRYRAGAAPARARRPTTAAVFDDVRFTGRSPEELPAPGLTRSALTVLDCDGFEYSLGPVLVPEHRVRHLLADLAAAEESV
ncbi:hypothetical protein [Microbacterium sp. T2.11-28]|uniref:hypothetical protein n=1 Tax=Microbacterium sp. T2.11-28 TaxID=3041169 RepID=UPI0024779BCD|nr:hypothetical protein [Microbacterium sp. T2.11-28]CAI9391211.1 hypothetical protein MICABA_01699 [Microbacterium sp. T2.11-28]